MRNRKVAVGLLVFVLGIVIVQAFSILSLDQIDFSTNGDTFEKQWFLLVSEDGREDMAVGTYPSSHIKDGDTQAAKDLKIQTEITRNSCTYTIQNTNVPIMKVQVSDVVKWDVWNIPKEISNCEQKPNYYGVYNPRLSFHVYCFTTANDAFVGKVSAKKYDFNTKISLTTDGETKSVDISNSDKVSGSVPDFFTARWQGSLSTGQECPDITSISPVYDSGSVEWKLVNDLLIATYRSYHATGMKSCINDAINDNNFAETIDSCMDRYNLLADQAQSPTTFTISGSTGVLKTGSSTFGEVVVADVQPFQFPVIGLKINADWIGIVQPITKPRIVDCDSETFKQGENGVIQVTIKNDGSGGAVSVSNKCQEPFKSVGTTPIIQIGKGQTKTVSLPITLSTKEKVSGSCSVVVQDETDPSVKASKSCSVTAEGVALCTPNTKRCNGKLVEQCTASGTGYELLKQCGDTESCKLDENDNPSCVAGGIIGKAPLPTKECDPLWKIGDTTLLPNFSKDCVGRTSLFLISITIIAAIISFFLMLGFTNQRSSNKWLNYILSAVVAILVSVLIYQVFWYGVLAIILLIILWFIIPKPAVRFIGRRVSEARKLRGQN